MAVIAKLLFGLCLFFLMSFFILKQLQIIYWNWWLIVPTVDNLKICIIWKRDRKYYLFSILSKNQVNRKPEFSNWLPIDIIFCDNIWILYRVQKRKRRRIKEITIIGNYNKITNIVATKPYVYVCMYVPTYPCGIMFLNRKLWSLRLTVYKMCLENKYIYFFGKVFLDEM